MRKETYNLIQKIIEDFNNDYEPGSQARFRFKLSQNKIDRKTLDLYYELKDQKDILRMERKSKIKKLYEKNN